MSRPIDADALIAEIENSLWDWDSVNGITATTVLRQTISDIKNEPTIDAVPVVRCKDCRYSDDYYNDGSCYCEHPEQEMRYIGTNWNWYCADGERKEKE